MINRILFVFFLAILTIPVAAQEHVVPLQINPAVRRAYHSGRYKTRKSLLLQDTLNLPFLDDFSVFSVYPDPQLWSDRDAFINQTYGIDPPTIGVATLDALDEKGSIYDDANNLPFEADHLTSKPINLDYTPQAKIYLSFYYQPQGIADPPEPQDSLCLDFFAPMQHQWITVWNMPGDSMQRDTAQHFRIVILPVEDTAYLQKGFRFRFRNYASLTKSKSDPGRIGNCDQWNIDYVYLDKNRFIDDTVMHDVAIVAPLRSVLKTYEAMPWTQFRQTYLSEMGGFLPVTYRNNDTIIRNVTRNFEIRDMSTGQLSHTYTGGATNMQPLEKVTYKSPLIYTFDSPSTDSVVFQVRSYLITDDFDPKANDTVTYYQVFRNYFAYDDGSAEAGYGLSGSGTVNSAVAVRFHSFKTDTLQAILIYFNESYKQANQNYFNLTIWDDTLGTPGDIMYEKTSLLPVYEDSLDRFTTYILDSAVVIPKGDFHVGWQQNSNTFLNVGLDMNRDSRDKNKIRVNGQWSQSSISGTIMIRPVTGHNLLTAAFPVHNYRHWKIYPQPADHFLYIHYAGDIISNGGLEYSLFDFSGRLVYRRTGFLETLNVSELQNGIYFLVIQQKGIPLYNTKIIIVH